MNRWQIHYSASTVSTNADAGGGRPFDVFTADEQTAGRGRLDHVWLSPPGLNLYFSAVLPVGERPAADVATLPLVVGLALRKSLSLVLSEVGADVSCLIKWPNDVLAGGRKLCGILCERHGDNVIAGVGVNVNIKTAPAELVSRMTSLALLADRAFDRDAVLSEILASLFEFHSEWIDKGFAPLAEEFAQYDALKGRTVSILQTDSDTAPLVGLCGGVQKDGTLLVGSTPVYSGEAHITDIS